MHCDHDIFTQAIKEKRKVKVAFLSDEEGCSQVKLCAPVDFEQYDTEGEKSSRYYFWDFKKGTNGAPLILSPGIWRICLGSWNETGANLAETKWKSFDGKTL
ncbi:MAG: hypothetical protein ACYSUB_22000 [Planctomycetota bacterium]|jgi:hypothetical protein